MTPKKLCFPSANANEDLNKAAGCLKIIDLLMQLKSFPVDIFDAIPP